MRTFWAQSGKVQNQRPEQIPPFSRLSQCVLACHLVILTLFIPTLLFEINLTIITQWWWQNSLVPNAPSYSGITLKLQSLIYPLICNVAFIGQKANLKIQAQDIVG